MKKIFLLLALLLMVSSSFIVAQTFQVKFVVNMNIEFSKGRLTAADGVYARGNFNDWGESQLTDADGDRIYEGTFTVDPAKLEAGTNKMFYKFYHNGAGGVNTGWESDVNGGNRNAVITANTDLPAAFYNSGDFATGGTYTAVDADVNFSIDMSLPIMQGFDPAVGKVYVAGSFTDWGTGAVELTDADGDKKYTKTVQITSGTVLMYKFIFNSQGGAASAGTWESPENQPYMSDVITGDNNRIYGVIDGTNDVARFWNNTDPNIQLASGAITFNLDMGVLEELGVYDPAVDVLQIRGGFNGWSDADRARTYMNQDPLFPEKWFLSVPFVNQEVNGTQTYKYYVVLQNPGIWLDTWERPNSTGGGDRSVTFKGETNQQELPLYYDDVHPAFFIGHGQTVSIKFRVNMTDAFDANKVAVPMEAGDKLYWLPRQPLFQRMMGWEGAEDAVEKFELTDADGDKIYEGTMTITGPLFNAFQYRYGYKKADGSWQREPTALGTAVSGRVRYIPQPASRQFTQPYTAPIDTWATDADKSSQFETWPAGLSSVRDLEFGIPTQYTLDQNYPNPFNPTTVIRFSVPNDQLVSLKIYNVLGQEVAVLVNKELKAGSYEFDFNASKMSSGIYFYQLNAGSFSSTKKMMLIK